MVDWLWRLWNGWRLIHRVLLSSCLPFSPWSREALGVILKIKDMNSTPTDATDKLNVWRKTVK